VFTNVTFHKLIYVYHDILERKVAALLGSFEGGSYCMCVCVCAHVCVCKTKQCCNRNITAQMGMNR
jgi:hypothetical protein